MPSKSRADAREIRHARVRKKVTGTAERPRLAVYRSLKHISVQLIDDTKGLTLCSASSLEKELKAKGNAEGAKAVGAAVAKRAKDKGVNAVVLDRGGYQ